MQFFQASPTTVPEEAEIKRGQAKVGHNTALSQIKAPPYKEGMIDHKMLDAEVTNNS
jgi:hypothetical protein